MADNDYVHWVAPGEVRDVAACGCHVGSRSVGDPRQYLEHTFIKWVKCPNCVGLAHKAMEAEEAKLDNRPNTIHWAKLLGGAYVCGRIPPRDRTGFSNSMYKFGDAQQFLDYTNPNVGITKCQDCEVAAKTEIEESSIPEFEFSEVNQASIKGEESGTKVVHWIGSKGGDRKVKCGAKGNGQGIHIWMCEASKFAKEGIFADHRSKKRCQECLKIAKEAAKEGVNSQVKILHWRMPGHLIACGALEDVDNVIPNPARGFIDYTSNKYRKCPECLGYAHAQVKKAEKEASAAQIKYVLHWTGPDLALAQTRTAGPFCKNDLHPPGLTKHFFRLGASEFLDAAPHADEFKCEKCVGHAAYLKVDANIPKPESTGNKLHFGPFIDQGMCPKYIASPSPRVARKSLTTYINAQGRVDLCPNCLLMAKESVTRAAGKYGLTETGKVATPTDAELLRSVMYDNQGHMKNAGQIMQDYAGECLALGLGLSNPDHIEIPAMTLDEIRSREFQNNINRKYKNKAQTQGENQMSSTALTKVKVVKIKLGPLNKALLECPNCSNKFKVLADTSVLADPRVAFAMGMITGAGVKPLLGKLAGSLPDLLRLVGKVQGLKD